MQHLMHIYERSYINIGSYKEQRTHILSEPKPTEIIGTNSGFCKVIILNQM